MTRGLTIEQLRATNPLRHFLPAVLADEARRGRIEQAADGTWQATTVLVETYGTAFSHLGHLPTTPKEGDRP